MTVTDSVPGGLVPTSTGGAGWTCNFVGQDVTCTRSDPLLVGQGYPIILTVTVQPGAPSSVTNQATVAGGADVNTTNNTASDPTTIIPGADLTITKSHTGNFTQGQTGATLTLPNSGGVPTSGAVILADSVPAGLVPTAASGTGWTCGVAGATVNCSRSDPLSPAGSYGPITVTVDVAISAPSSVTNTATIAGGGDVNTANNTATDIATVIPGPDLLLSKSHVGNFMAGQTGAQFTVTVTNSGGAPTSGMVTVVGSTPTGLVPTAASGAGWTCGVTGSTITCSRSDPLAPGAGYGPITVTVDVAISPRHQ